MPVLPFWTATGLSVKNVIRVTLFVSSIKILSNLQ